jgi:hypothetical protein
MLTESFIQQQLDRFEDFWHRRDSAATHEIVINAYGYPVQFATNDPRLLDIPGLCADRYSQCDPIVPARPIQLNFILDQRLPAKRVPRNWPAHLRYNGTTDWLTVNAEPWVNSCADLKQQIGLAFVSTSIARHPLLLSRYVGDCFVLNMLLRTGWGELHASCLQRDGRAILLIGPHNAGKSTTAFRLTMNGYQLLSDGMTFVRVHNPKPDLPQSQKTTREGNEIELLGYPIGEVKLRMDMLSEFPQIKKRGRKTLVREDTKMVFNLREVMPERMLAESIRPREIVVCLVERATRRTTTAEPIERETALIDLLPNSSHWNEVGLLKNNLASVETLIDRARCYRLKIGSDVAGIIRTVEAV